MSELYGMISILSRDQLPDFYKVYQAQGVPTGIVSLGYGTVRSDALGYLGLDEEEKAVDCAVVSSETWTAIKKKLIEELYIHAPNRGIALLVPLSSLAGMRELRFLTDGQAFIREEESSLKGTKQELLVVVCNQGHNELVMDAAREAGAGGGTVLHARGTGREKEETFFGFSLASEKDVILIATQAEQKNTIMQAIMEKAGMDSRARSIILSLPVADSAGLRM